jgi:hypothetical protein
MKSTFAILAAAASLTQVTATFRGGFHNAPPFSCPGNQDNVCEENQHGGYDWSDLNPGHFEDYDGFKWNGWTCEDSFSRRDLLAPRTFGGKVISGSCGPEPSTAPSFECGPQRAGKSFSVKKFDVTVEFDCRLEFHYDMPDGSVCRHQQDCRSGGTTVHNTQCGGATKVRFVLPPQANLPKPNCHIGVHHIDFDCDDNTPPRPPYHPPTPPTTTTSAELPVETTSQPAEEIPTTSEEIKTTTSEEIKTTTSEESKTTTSPAEETTPIEESTSLISSTSAVETTETSEAPVTTTSAEETTVATTSAEETTVTSEESKTTTSPAEETTPIEESTSLISSTSAVETTKTSEAPVTTSPAEETPITTAPVETSVETTVITTTYDTVSTIYTTSVQTVTSCAPEVPNCPGGGEEVTVTIPVTVTTCPVTETITHTGPTQTAVVPTPGDEDDDEELPCDEVVPKCLNTFFHLVESCQDNTDSACYCPNQEFITEVYKCVYAHGASDDIIAESIHFLQGVCAPAIPSNPGIVTGADSITEHITITGTITATSVAYTTVHVETTITEPCVSDGTTIPGSSTVVTISTEVTVPEVTLPTATATPTDGGELPGDAPAPTTFFTQPPAGTGEITVPTSSIFPPPSAGNSVRASLGLGMVVMVAAAALL